MSLVADVAGALMFVKSLDECREKEIRFQKQKLIPIYRANLAESSLRVFDW